jgi:hypothetical protein
MKEYGMTTLLEGIKEHLGLPGQVEALDARGVRHRLLLLEHPGRAERVK